jgi:hypothetical protein
MRCRRMCCGPTARKAPRTDFYDARHQPVFAAPGGVLQWTLTRRGSNLLDKCRRHAMTLERRLVSGLGAKGQATVRRWLAKIAAELQQDG